jgi:methyltransferase
MAESFRNWYFALLVGVALLRVAELRFSRHHQVQLLAAGGKKVAEPFYPLMVVVHAGLFVASALEVWLYQRPFVPVLGLPMLSLLALCLAGRIWVWHSLGEQWNVQVVISTQPVVDWGPYRYVRHPNYCIVIVEMFALPLVHSAYFTAVVFSALNALILWQRMGREEAALFTRPEYRAKMGMKPRFVPALFRDRSGVGSASTSLRGCRKTCRTSQATHQEMEHGQAAHRLTHPR